MTDKQIPSPLEVLARIDQALENSGLKTVKTEREPLPLFRQLLSEWQLDHGAGDVDWTGDLSALLTLNTLSELRHTVRRCYQEACQLSRAHGRLTQWNQKELEKEYDAIVQHIDQYRLSQSGT
ncbi:MAG: hypothetical protein CMI02_06395 [Oceanospirillaceae bacterium]|nr:hypothetical protein [Oceanospirillaceae bacterium]MBT11645.1 hypothetical protein [Oceanospirillaceae bacterium]|tara:strand:+ start:13797 stop:14165 length:369 start_codon:yes stop_codon:yes gene_type:complete